MSLILITFHLFLFFFFHHFCVNIRLDRHGKYYSTYIYMYICTYFYLVFQKYVRTLFNERYMKYVWKFRPPSNTCFWKRTDNNLHSWPCKWTNLPFSPLLLHFHISIRKGLCSLVFRMKKPGDHNSIVSRLRAGWQRNCVSIPGRGQTSLSWLLRPDWLWRPTSLSFPGHRG